MTEQEWMTCTDPLLMLGFLRRRASARKLRLFACACGRGLGASLAAGRGREAVEAAERFADGLGRKEELTAARRRAGDPIAKSLCYREAYYAAWRACLQVSDALARPVVPERRNRRESYHAWAEARGRELRRLCGPLRDVVGPLPFRPLALPHAVLAWDDGTVRRLAQAIYDERQLPPGALDSGRLSILADALLDAGCEDEGLIQHCRSEGPHVRGCWAIDLILGKG